MRLLLQEHQYLYVHDCLPTATYVKSCTSNHVSTSGIEDCTACCSVPAETKEEESGLNRPGLLVRGQWHVTQFLIESGCK
jgi:hypothetical protein